MFISKEQGRTNIGLETYSQKVRQAMLAWKSPYSDLPSRHTCSSWPDHWLLHTTPDDPTDRCSGSSRRTSPRPRPSSHQQPGQNSSPNPPDDKQAEQEKEEGTTRRSGTRAQDRRTPAHRRHHAWQRRPRRPDKRRSAPDRRFVPPSAPPSIPTSSFSPA